MGYNFTEQNYIIDVNHRHNDETSGHVAWMISTGTY